jgi:hypothetical protein
MSDDKLDTCGCCEGENRLTPADTYNRPGLDALAFRVGTHAAFFETMIAGLAREEITLETIGADGKMVENTIRPLEDLKTRRRDDFSIALLDAWATIADVLTFYQERIANEGYLRTATERRSILELARLVGYELQPGVAASTFLSFMVEKAEQPALIPKGTRAQNIPAPGETMQSFETMRDLEARYEYNELKLRLAQPQFLKIPTPEKPLPDVLYLPGMRSDLRQSDRVLLAFGNAGFNETFEFKKENSDASYWLAQVKSIDLLDQPARTAVSLQPKPTEISNPRSVVMGIDYGKHRYDWVMKHYLQEAWSTTAVVNAIRKAAMISSLSPEKVERKASNQDVGFQGAAALNTQFAENIYATMGQEVAPLKEGAPALRALALLRLQAHLHGHNAPLKGVTKEISTGTNSKEFETILLEWSSPTELVDLSRELQTLSGRLQKVIDPLSGDLEKNIRGWDELAIKLGDEDLRKLLIDLENRFTVPVSGKLQDLTHSLSQLAQELNDANYINQWDDLFKCDGKNVTVTLDRVHEEIGQGSQVILEWKGNNGPNLALFNVEAIDIVSTSLFNVPATATRLTLTWIKGSEWKPDTMAIIRSTTVYAASEFIDNPVPARILAEEPLTEAVGQITYVVKESDIPGGLDGIAHNHNLSPDALAEANNLDVDHRTLYEGQTLIIPPGARGQVTYNVRVGDTLESIAQSHNVAQVALVEANKQDLTQNSALEVGKTLIIPLELELDGIYADLKPGRWVAITGMRTDIPVVGREVALIQAVRHSFATLKDQVTDLPGDLRHTFVMLASPLNLSYECASVTLSANVVPATHGETARGVPPNERDVILGSGDGAQAHLRFELKLPPGKRLTYLSAPTRDGVESTLEVYVSDVLWHPVPTLIDAKPTDHVYIVQTDDEGKTDVIFGDGIEGARPPTGRENVYARYRVGIGKAGNVKAGQISLLATRPAGVKEVNNSVAATGGTDPESRDQARGSVKFSVRTLDRLVGLQDYQDFARTFAGIGKARAKRDDGGITVWVAGEDRTSLEADSAVLGNLQKVLDEHDGSNVAIVVKLYTPLLITLEATVWISPDYLWEKVQPAIQAALYETFGFAQRDLGQTAALSEILAVIQRVPGVVHVQTTHLAALTEDQLIEQAKAQNNQPSTEVKPIIAVEENQLAFIDSAVPSLIVLRQPESEQGVPS